MPISKQLIARNSDGQAVSGGALRAYQVSFTSAGVPVKGTLAALYDAAGNLLTQSGDSPVSDANGRLDFMLEAGVYWLEVTRGPNTFEIRSFPVGRAAERDVGAAPDQLPDGETLESLLLPDPDGNEGKVLIVGGSGDPVWIDPKDVEGIAGGPYAIIALPNGETVTLTNIDSNRFLEQSGASDTTARIATNASVNMAIGRMFHLTRLGPGELFIEAVAGVTLNGIDGGSTKVVAPYGGATLYKRGTDAWIVQGQIDEVE